MLHLDQEKKSESEHKSKEDSSKKSVSMHAIQDTKREESSLTVNLLQKPTTYVVLSTAKIIVKDAEGRQLCCRALLDAGSQSNLITEELVNRLKLKCKRHKELISGINGSETNVG